MCPKVVTDLKNSLDYPPGILNSHGLTKVRILKIIIFCHFWLKLGKNVALISGYIGQGYNKLSKVK